MRRIACLLAILAVRAMPAAAAAPLDHTDPAAVGEAYLAALQGGDAETVLGLLVDDVPLANMIRMMQQQIAAEAGGRAENPLNWMLELLFVPFPRGDQTLIRGEVTTADGTATIALRQELTKDLKLVLARREDGTWRVDLRASLNATVGEGNSMLLRQAEMMANLPAEQAAMVQEPRPWELENAMRILADALSAYAEEHDGKLPEADAWCDELRPYLEGEKPFAAPNFADETYSFAFNGDLSEGTLPQDWETMMRTPLLVSVEGDEPNAVFFPDELATIEPRIGDSNLVMTAAQNGLSVPRGKTLADLAADNDRADATSQRLSALVTAAIAYADANDGLLPGADTWCDDLADFLPRIAGDGGEPLVAPGVENAECTFAINRELAGRNYQELVNRRRLVLFIETDPVPRNTAVAPDHRGPQRHRTLWNSSAPAGFHRAYLNGGVSLEQTFSTPAEPAAAEEAVAVEG